MKRSLIILSLAVLLVLPLTLAGCGDGGTTLTESDKATILGFGKRLDGHDTDIGILQGKTMGLDAATVAKLVALDADALAALLDLDLSTIVDDVDQLKTDVSDINDPDKAGSLADIVARVGELENGGTNNGGTATSGEVTVTLDVAEEPFIFMSGATPASQVFPIEITNGTDEYQQVTFNITLRCISTDYKADVAAGPAMTVSGVSLGTTPVPSLTGCQWIYFLWIDTNSIPVAPGKEVSLYVSLSNFQTTSGYEVWEVTLAGVTVKKL